MNKHYFNVFFITLVILGLFSGCKPKNEVEYEGGRAVRFNTSNPIPNARVELLKILSTTPEDGNIYSVLKEYTTDSDGKFPIESGSAADVVRVYGPDTSRFFPYGEVPVGFYYQFGKQLNVPVIPYGWMRVRALDVNPFNGYTIECQSLEGDNSWANVTAESRLYRVNGNVPIVILYRRIIQTPADTLYFTQVQQSVEFDTVNVMYTF